MKKLVQPSNGGFPYQNEDFYNILQNEQIASYSAFYKSITNNANSSNTGVILFGCSILSFDGSNYLMDFQNSMVYLDGEFLKADDTINTQLSITGDFYLIPTTPTVTQRTYRDNIAKNATTERRFTWTNAQPASGQWIAFSNGGSSRYLKTVLRNATTETGTIVQVSNISKFFSNGLGYNEWSGWAICNGSNGTVNLKGKFVIGYDSTASTSPTTNPSPTQRNYGLIGNTGGLNSLTLTLNQLPVYDNTIQASVKNVVNGVRLTTGGSGGVDNVLRTWDSTDTNRIFNIPAETDIRTRVQFGNGDTIENRPEYVVLAFVQKI